MRRRTAIVAVAVCLAAVPALAGDWLQWGGPSDDFTIESPPLQESWPETGPPVLWKRALGDGYSSILARGDRLYTMYRDGENDVVVGLDATTGATVWEHRFAQPYWPDQNEGRQRFTKGPNATPALVGGRLIAIGMAGTVRCLDAGTGALLWSKDLPAEFGRQKRDEEYGYSAAPIPYGDVVIVQVGGTKHGVIAIKPEDGAVVWGSEPTTVSYAQARVLGLQGRDQYVYFSTAGVHGLDPTTGATLWFFELPYNNGNHLTPAVRGDDRHLYVASQFATGGGRLLRFGGESDHPTVEEVWFTPKLRASCWTLVRQGEYVYGSAGGNDVSFMAAFHWRSGRIAWRKRGFHMAQSLWADGKLIFLNEDGTLTLARVSPDDLEILGSHQVTESVSWTLPTLVDGTLYVRDRKHILALDLSRPAAAAEAPAAD